MRILDELNPAQREAVTFGFGPLLILAGAGSGKTRVLTYRVAHMIGERRVSSEEILLMTFTNKASEEMLKRVKNLLTLAGLNREGHVAGGTFHSFCAKILRLYARRAELEPNFVIFDSGDQLETIKQAMAILGIDPKTTKPGSILGAISSAKNELIEPSEYASLAQGSRQQLIARVYLEYQKLLKKYHALDFDDLLAETVKLFRNDQEVCEAVWNRFKHILVDEYQDTNKAQYEITKLLALKHRNLTVVGDAAQAIYSWRGANYRNLLLLKQDFPDLTILHLEQNYRSTQVILDAANRVVSKNGNHPVLKLWTEKKGGEKIILFEAESELDEARYVLNKIQEKAIVKGISYSNFAVLYRTNAQSRVLEEVFLREGVPYTLVGGLRFYERKEIKDILAYLRLVLNPEEEVARKRAEKNGKAKLNKLLNGNVPPKNSTLNILDEVLKVTGYLEQFEESCEEDAARIENVRELRSVAAQFDSLPEFLERIALTEKEAKRGRAQEEGGRGHGAVTLMTLHSAKGLEFRQVFMVGMEEGLFPHLKSLSDAEGMEEERRLCYVGMTRAMDNLTLTYAVKRLYFGTRSSNTVSRFLADIPEELIDDNRGGAVASLARKLWTERVRSNLEFNKAEMWGKL